jgi:hypothetical protein
MIREVETDPFVFRNAVSNAGYEWEDGKNGEYLAVRGVAVHIKELHPGLFREFAEIETTREGIRKFAMEYGDLFNHWRGRERGTSASVWRKEILEMRILVALWDQIQKPDTAALKKIVVFTKDGPWYTLSWPGGGLTTGSLAYESTPSLPSEPIRYNPIQFDGDVLLAARCALQIEVNKRLTEHSTVPLLAWTPDTKEASGGYHQRVNFKPSNLLAAMWVQFAQDITGEFQLRRCWCGKYFQVGPGAGRADKVFHDDVCKGTYHQKNGGKGKPKKARKSLR